MDPAALQFIDDEAKLSRHNSSIKRGKRRDSDVRKPLKRSGSKLERKRSGAKRIRTSSLSLAAKDEVLSPKEVRRRRIVLAVLLTFAFLLVSSVLVVVVTLTQTTFHSTARIPFYVRKENEQLMNSLNRAGVEPVDDGASSGVLANLTSSMVTTPGGSTVEVATALPPEALLQNASSSTPPP